MTFIAPIVANVPALVVLSLAQRNLKLPRRVHCAKLKLATTAYICQTLRKNVFLPKKIKL